MSASDKENDGLAVGDQMVLSEGSWPARRSVVPVVRLTKTQIIVDADGRQRRFTRRGYWHEVGRHGYHTPSLSRATPELLAQVEAENYRAGLIRRIESVHTWRGLPTATLAAVVAALDALDAQEAPASPPGSEGT
jgi:hypothetical protein